MRQQLIKKKPINKREMKKGKPPKYLKSDGTITFSQTYKVINHYHYYYN